MNVIDFCNITIQHAWVAAFTFQLQGGVLNIVFVEKDFVYSALNRNASADGQIIRHYMSRKHAQIFIDAPNVQVMDAAHAFDSHQIIYHVFHVNIFGGAFEQNVNGLSQNAPGVPKNEYTDQDTDKRIEPIPFCEEDNNPRHDSPNGG